MWQPKLSNDKLVVPTECAARVEDLVEAPGLDIALEDVKYRIHHGVSSLCHPVNQSMSSSAAAATRAGKGWTQGGKGSSQRRGSKGEDGRRENRKMNRLQKGSDDDEEGDEEDDGEGAGGGGSSDSDGSARKRNTKGSADEDDDEDAEFVININDSSFLSQGICLYILVVYVFVFDALEE